MKKLHELMERAMIFYPDFPMTLAVIALSASLATLLVVMLS